jgi:hypothetical protein
MAFGYSLRSFCIFFSIWYVWTTKNLATLFKRRANIFRTKVSGPPFSKLSYQKIICSNGRTLAKEKVKGIIVESANLATKQTQSIQIISTKRTGKLSKVIESLVSVHLKVSMYKMCMYLKTWTFTHVNFETQGYIQGDQIGRIFALWAIVYCGHFFENNRISTSFCATFFLIKDYVLITTKNALGYIFAEF